MDSLDLELEFNALRHNSHFESDFDSTRGGGEFSKRIIERSAPKPAKIEREISRLAEPYRPAENSATGGEEQRQTGFDRCWRALRNAQTN